MKSIAKPLDPLFVRGQFPVALWKWAFFENAGGSYVPKSVIKRLTAYMSENQVQPGTYFPCAAKALERVNTGNDLMAAMIGANPNEVVIGPSTSINIYVLANALRSLWDEGSEIIVAVQNHEANSTPGRGFRIPALRYLIGQYFQGPAPSTPRFSKTYFLIALGLFPFHTSQIF